MHYTYSLAERLGMTQRQLTRHMSSKELMGWMAYDLSNNDEFKNKIEIERQKAFTADQEADAIKNLFRSICG